MTGATSEAVQELVAKQAIRNAMLRYCRGVDRGDADLIGSAYHLDAVDEHGVATYTGETVGPGIAELMSSSRVCMHMVANHLIDLRDGDHAGWEAYFGVWQTMSGRDGEEVVLHALGRYLDQMERRNGEWRIAHRLVIVDLTRLLAPGEGVPPSRPGFGAAGPHRPVL